jgi:hypothetical protein
MAIAGGPQAIKQMDAKEAAAAEQTKSRIIAEEEQTQRKLAAIAAEDLLIKEKVS